MKKIKICKKLSKLIHIDCSDMDCDCLNFREFVAIEDILKLNYQEWDLVKLKNELNFNKQSKVS